MVLRFVPYENGLKVGFVLKSWVFFYLISKLVLTVFPCNDTRKRYFPLGR
jgi:hypothetical protein